MRAAARLVAVGVALGIVGAAAAQMRPVAIEGATLLTGTGEAAQTGTVVFQGGRITAVGAKAEVSLLARKFAGRGRFVTPGFIDLYSTLGMSLSGGGGTPTACAADAFDRYVDEDLKAAWQAGITAICAPAHVANGFGGRGSVLRLSPRASLDELVLKPETDLYAAIGPIGALGRIRVADDLRKRLLAAREYRDAWNDYEDNVKEYEGKLAEWAKDKGGEAGGDGGKKGASFDPAEDDLAKKEKKEEKKEEKKDAKPEEKKEPPKKPGEPGKDRGAEVLLKLLDGDLRLWAEVDEPADILNVLAIAEELNVAVVIAGGTGAHRVAGELAKAHVPVVLADAPATVAYRPGAARYADPAAAAILQRAGVEVYFGSGGVPSGSTPSLPLRLASAIGNGFDAEQALQCVTGRAARLVGAQREIGRLLVGLRADMVVWSDHPLAPGARVERVFVGGEQVYRADSELPEDEE